MRPIWLALPWLCGCGGAEAPELLCRPGFALGPDGHCYPPPPDYPAPVVTDVLDNLDDCSLRPATGDIDLAGGCLSGICVGDRFERVDTAIGSTADCTPLPDSNDVSCVWDDEIGGRFEADEDRALPTARAQWVRALRPFDGTTKEGLGTRVAPRCFVEQLDEPSRVLFQDAIGELLVSQMAWDAYGIIALDIVDRRGNDLPDGSVDELILLGPP